MALFKKGFLKYLKTGAYADIVVICNGVHYKAHRAILAYNSSYFERLLLSEFRESSQPYVSLKFPDPQNVFPELLVFMYTGRVCITLDNVIPLLAVADHYLVEDLCALCDTFLASNIQRDTALIIIKNALDFHFGDVIEKCITVIAKNFNSIEADYDFLPPPLFLKLLQHPYLVVRNEYALYEYVCHFIEVHPEIQQDQVEDMMATIRFVWMTYDELSKVALNPEVPRGLIIETCMERLKKYESPPSLRAIKRNSVYELSFSNMLMLDCDNPRLRPRPPQSYIFEYTADDTHGIMYHIATQGGSAPWVNPVTSGRISILASSGSLERGNPQDIVELKPQDVWSRDVPSSWITIDLGPKRAVVPTAYTLRHGMNFRSDSLRTWDLQGSINGENWILCRRHANDQALNAGYATHTWKLSSTQPPPSPAPQAPTLSTTTSPSTSPTMTIVRSLVPSSTTTSTTTSTPTTPSNPSSSPAIPPLTPFRYFRILQTGRNSNNRNFLVVSGFELYGELFERE